MNDLFRKFAHKTGEIMGTPWAFIFAIILIAVWLLAGSSLGYSEAWQLIINTGTTIVTFIMVILLQNTQNRDTRAIHLKLDELIRAVAEARTRKFVDLEDLSDEELDRIHAEFVKFHERRRKSSNLIEK